MLPPTVPSAGPSGGAWWLCHPGAPYQYTLHWQILPPATFQSYQYSMNNGTGLSDGILKIQKNIYNMYIYIPKKGVYR